MNCDRCGGAVREGDRFCPHCGASAAAPASGQASIRRKSALPGWAWAMIIVGVVGVFILPFVAVIAAIVIPTMNSTRDAAMKSFAEGLSLTVRSAEAAYFAQNERYADLVELSAGGYLDDRFGKNPSEITGFDGRPKVTVKLVIADDEKSFEVEVRVDGLGAAKVSNDSDLEFVYE